MPPANRQLQWTKIEKFGGMWTAGDKLLMPPDAAQLMSGCHPQPQGGLRAFYKAVPDIAIGNATGSLLADPPRWGGSMGNPIGIVALCVYHVGETWHVIYGWAADTLDTGYDSRIPQRPDLGLIGPWRLRTEGGDTPLMVTAFPTGNNPLYPNNILPKVVLLRPTSSATSILPTAYMVIVPEPLDSAGALGLWEMIDGSTYDIGVNDRTIRAVEIHQSRVIAAVFHSVVFSSPGTMDITTAYTKYINLAGGNVLWMLPLAPSDLLVGTTSGAIFNIQGDLDDPVVRTLIPPGHGVGYHHVPANTRYGPVAITSVGPTVVGTDGAFEPLAESLDRELWQHHGGALAYWEDILYAPNWHIVDPDLPADELNEIRSNGALAFDFRSGAWFTTSHPDDVDCPNPVNITVDPVDVFSTTLYAANYYEAYQAGRPDVYVTPTRLIPMDSPAETTLSYYYDTDGDRASIYEWMSAPLHAPDGREVELQEVQLGVMGFHAATGSTLTLTATNEFDETATVGVDIRDGRGVYTAPLRLRGQYVDVRLKAVAHDGSEAPMIEYIAFGWTPGHLPQDNPSGGYPTAYPGGY